jgi:tetrahydromethanopterin S-methyltransferase subunit C
VTGGFSPIRINAGGMAYTDSSGIAWGADTGFSGGYVFTTSSAIGNTSSQPLYQTERYGDGILGYTFAAPNGSYTVKLKFAEIYFTSCGKRIFNVAINGSTVDSRFDACAAAGGANLAVDRSYTVTVTNSQIAIVMTGVVDNPTVSAIEITSGASAPPPPPGFTPIRINAGGASYTDTSGNVWAADPSTVGYSFATSAAIGNTGNAPTLYQTERWNPGTVQYSFTVPNAAYSVKLKFAEIYFTTCGHRIFNVVVNGSTLDANFDPCAAGGGPNLAADRTYNVTVTTGLITILLNAVADNPTISAIEITSGSGTSTPPPPPAFTPIRVNAGGPGYTDPSGNAWAADVNPTGYSFSTSAAIGNTTAAPLYQTERWYTSPLQYAFSVPNSTYTVTLKFAEIYFTTCGHRIFNININGTVVDPNFDPCAAGGGPNRAADRTYTVTVTSGQIAISLIPVLDNPTISAIQIQ